MYYFYVLHSIHRNIGASALDQNNECFNSKAECNWRPENSDLHATVVDPITMRIPDDYCQINGETKCTESQSLILSQRVLDYEHRFDISVSICRVISLYQWKCIFSLYNNC